MGNQAIRWRPRWRVCPVAWSAGAVVWNAGLQTGTLPARRAGSRGSGPARHIAGAPGRFSR